MQGLLSVLVMSLVFTITIAFVVAQPGIASERLVTTTQIIFDNSPALMSQSNAEIAESQLLYWTWKLKRRKATRHTVINIISTVNAQNRWQGTPVDLGRNGAAAVGAIQIIENGCPNLIGALEQVRINLELLRPETANVILFSSLIHSYPCANQTIELPQPVPVQLDLSFLSTKGVKLTILWAHPLQKNGWLKAIQNAGLKNFQLLDPAATKALLKQRGGPYRD